MEQRSFIFKKDYTTSYGTIKKNSELRLFRGFVYLNGGMLHQAYQDMFINLVNNDGLRNEYLEEINIIENKI